MTEELFDHRLVRLHRERSLATGGDFFLHRRAIEELAARVKEAEVSITNGLLFGIPTRDLARKFDIDERAWTVVDYHRGLSEIEGLIPGSLSVIVVIGELHVAADPRLCAFALAQALKPGGQIFGAVPSINSLPRLRDALRTADRIEGGVHARFQPGFDGPALAELLSSIGLADVVIDVDRFAATYASLDRLLTDLRASGCTNVLRDSAPPLSRRSLVTAREEFLSNQDRANETFELLFFGAKRPSDRLGSRLS